MASPRARRSGVGGGGGGGAAAAAPPVRRRWRVSLLAAAAAAAAVAVVTPAARAQAPTPPPGALSGPAERVRALMTAKADIIVELSLKARSVLVDQSRCDEDRSCACSQSSCARKMPESLTCTTRLGHAESVCQDEDGTPGSCVARKLDYTQSYVHVAPNLLDAAGGSVVSRLGEDICFTRDLNPDFVRLAALDSGPWTYFSSASGMIRLFPGMAFQGGEDYTDCAKYDPRMRPWYVTGTVGAKDTVILVDASAAMSRPVGSSGEDATVARSRLAFDSVTTILDTFQESDAVAVVAYGLNTPTGVQVLTPNMGMAMATNKVKSQILANLAPLNASSGVANPVQGLEKAFDVLEAGLGDDGVTSGCTRVIIVIGGSPPGSTNCEAACAKDRSRPCRCVAEAMAAVNARQVALERRVNQTAVIAAATIGEGSDDGLLRQAACLPRSSGVWAHIASKQENILTALSSLSRLLSSSQWTADPPSAGKAVASALYQDAGGFGLMATLTIPVYDTPVRQLLGVVGTDILAEELVRAANGSQQAVDAELKNRPPQCIVATEDGRPLRLTGCEIQQAREGVQCPALGDEDLRAWEFGRYDCWVAQRHVYVPINESVTRAEAARMCAERLPDGTLAEFYNSAENGPASSLLPPDGAWIGLTRDEGGDTWMVDRPPETAGDPPRRLPVLRFASWARDQPVDGAELNCATADRRGVSANWVATDCERPRPMLCSFPVERLPDAAMCAAADLAFKDRPVRLTGELVESNPDPQHPECVPELVRDGTPEDCQSLTATPLCAIGDASSPCVNTCCDGCLCRLQLEAATDTGRGALSTGEIVGIVAGIGVGIAVVGGLVLFGYRRHHNHEELPLPMQPGMIGQIPQPQPPMMGRPSSEGRSA